MQIKQRYTKEDVAVIACLIERFLPQLRPLLLNSSPIFILGIELHYLQILISRYSCENYWVAFLYVLIAVDNVEYEFIFKNATKNITQSQTFSSNIKFECLQTNLYN